MKTALKALLTGATVLAAGCGDDPVPLTGRVIWTVSCIADGGGANCPATRQRVEPTPGPRVLMECAVGPGSAGTSVTFRVAALDEGQDGFDLSTQAMFVTGTVNGAGQEMQSGRMVVRGLGWSFTSQLGPTQPCHVTVDTLNGKNITGRVRCEGAVDDQAPPRRRVVAGDVPSTRTGDSGEFTFSACSDPI
ncbi:MAG: hypothetical protein JNK72_07375 [Myxococcales bacterium]|nr:hypothetical protein [Myxococcales bacterium]